MLSDSQDLRHRGAVITMNLMEAERSLAEKFIESEALEILSVMAKGDNSAPSPEARIAQQCLDLAVGYGLIQAGPQAGEPRSEA